MLLQQRRQDERFKVKVDSVIEEFDKLVDAFKTEMISIQDTSSPSVEDIAIVFGATPVKFKISILKSSLNYKTRLFLIIKK